MRQSTGECTDAFLRQVTRRHNAFLAGTGLRGFSLGINQRSNGCRRFCIFNQFLGELRGLRDIRSEIKNIKLKKNFNIKLFIVIKGYFLCAGSIPPV